MILLTFGHIKTWYMYYSYHINISVYIICCEKQAVFLRAKHKELWVWETDYT